MFILIVALIFPTASFAKSELATQLEGTIILKVGSSTSFVKNVKKNVDQKDEKVKPVIKDGRALIPVRFVSESIGANVTYDKKTKKVTITYKDQTLVLTLGQKVLVKGKQKINLDVAAKTISGRTYLPFRAIVEALNKKVFYGKGIIIISDTEIKLDAKQLDRLLCWFDTTKNFFEEDVKLDTPLEDVDGEKVPEGTIEVPTEPVVVPGGGTTTTPGGGTGGGGGSTPTTPAYQIPQADIKAIKAIVEEQNAAFLAKDVDRIVATFYFKNDIEKSFFKGGVEERINKNISIAINFNDYTVISASETNIVLSVKGSYTTDSSTKDITVTAGFVKVNGTWYADYSNTSHKTK